MKPRALDLFCGQGGAGMGLSRAGFDVVGVDINPQPRYPFKFIQADALTVATSGFDFIWASPPCQAHSQMTQREYRPQHQDLIPATRELLVRSGLPWIMENVERAPLLDPIKLDGAMFGLNVIRIRWFESNRFLLTPRPVRRAAATADFCAIYGNGSGGNKRRQNGKTIDVAPGSQTVAAWRRAMEMPWATRDGLTQAIPPAYSEFLSKQIVEECRALVRRAA